MGILEILLILAIIFLLFGSKKLPQLGQGIGKAIRGFKESVNEITGEARELPPMDQEQKSKPGNRPESTNQKKS